MPLREPHYPVAGNRNNPSFNGDARWAIAQSQTRCQAPSKALQTERKILNSPNGNIGGEEGSRGILNGKRPPSQGIPIRTARSRHKRKGPYPSSYNSIHNSFSIHGSDLRKTATLNWYQAHEGTLANTDKGSYIEPRPQRHSMGFKSEDGCTLQQASLGTQYGPGESTSTGETRSNRTSAEIGLQALSNATMNYSMLKDDRPSMKLTPEERLLRVQGLTRALLEAVDVGSEHSQPVSSYNDSVGRTW
ncbi:hypothetical protein NliqN6_2345 [Naganishia liquefaciens]|uniref:Uncharacterized protein n=1 Tax=Naganishia liquefaciens TaxID=104408 RepID=A0A8H3YE65_9TREE|nr:hypothetical protein NliqN6_2345 [Naganishia liquefaciens]